MAKKIKNGARKIVLEKAEEARIAAFSAYESLGLNVPQFSQPVLTTAISSPHQKEATTYSPGNDTTNNLDNVEDVKNASKQSLEGTVHSNKVISVGGMKSTEPSNTGVVTSMEVKSIGDMRQKFGPCNSMVPIKGSINIQGELDDTFEHTTNDEMTIPKLQAFGDRTMIDDKNLDPGMRKSHSRENLSSGHKISTCEKGPIHAINTPGGFDSFLDLWDTVTEFCFDIYYNKRSEVNSAVPFDLHGLAICWENSAVYYVNIPKDLLCSNKERRDCLRLSATGQKDDMLNLDHWLDAFRRRWNKIREIMGKKDVRKFTWNLKVQIQALRSPAVSLTKFDCQKLDLDTVGFEIIDSSFLLLTPIHVRDGIDMCIVAWILWPDEERSSSPNLEKVIKGLYP